MLNIKIVFYFFAIVFVLHLHSCYRDITYGSFKYNNNIADPSDSSSCVILNDGTKVFGEFISYETGWTPRSKKGSITIVNHKFKLVDVKAYISRWRYFIKFGNTFFQRIVNGKVSVYVKFEKQFQSFEVVNNIRTGPRYAYSQAIYCVQNGIDGPITLLESRKQIKELMSSCPKAMALLEMSNSKFSEEIKKNANYLNSIFDMYNNGCQ